MYTDLNLGDTEGRASMVQRKKKNRDLTKVGNRKIS